MPAIVSRLVNLFLFRFGLSNWVSFYMILASMLKISGRQQRWPAHTSRSAAVADLSQKY